MVLEGGEKVFFTHPGMKYMAFVAVSSFSSFAVLLRRMDVFTTENKQGHVNQCFALTLDSLNTTLDSFSQGSLIIINIPVLFYLEKKIYCFYHYINN